MRTHLGLSLAVVSIASLSCEKKNIGTDSGSGSGSTGPGGAKDCTTCGTGAPSGYFDPTRLRLDLSGATGLAKMSSGGGAAALLLDSSHDLFADGGQSETSKLSKVTTDNEFEEIFKNDDLSDVTINPSRPPEIYKSPTGEVYLFTPDPVYNYQAQPKAGSMPESCQIFKSSEKLSAMTATNAVPKTMSCVIRFDNKSIQPQFWGMQGAEPTIQFDNQGRIYARVQSMGSPNAEILRIDPVNGNSKVMVNSNIQVSKFFSTPSGGLYFVGSSQGSESFRYVNPSGGVRTISEGWGVLFLPIAGDPDDRVIYVGMHPSNSQNNFGQREILEFNPNAEITNEDEPILDQVKRLVSGGTSLIADQWYGQATWETWLSDSCHATTVDPSALGSLGYNNTIIPNGDGSYLFVANSSTGGADFSYKPAGSAVCTYYSFTSSGSTPEYVVNKNETECASKINEPNFSAKCVSDTQKTAISDYQSFSSVMERTILKTPVLKLETASGKLVPIPFPAGVAVKKLWKIGSEFFYLQSKTNVFSLKRWIDGTSTGDKTIKANFEIYSLAKTGSDELIFSGLDFSNNEYGVGTIKLNYATNTMTTEMKDDVKVKISDIVTLE